MLDILRFIFSGFWTFVGSAILLVIVCQSIVTAIVAAKGRSDD